MKPLAFLMLFVLFGTADCVAQDYYKIKILSSKVKLVKADNSKDIFVIDSVQAQPEGKVFFLSGAETKITMEFLNEKQLVRLREVNVNGFYEPMDVINVSAVAINDQWLE